MKVFFLDGEHLTLEDVLRVAEGRAKVRVASSVVNKMRRSRNFIEHRQGFLFP